MNRDKIYKTIYFECMNYISAYTRGDIDLMDYLLDNRFLDLIEEYYQKVNKVNLFIEGKENESN